MRLLLSAVLAEAVEGAGVMEGADTSLGTREDSPPPGGTMSRRSPRSTPRRRAQRNVTHQVINADGVLDLSNALDRPAAVFAVPSLLNQPLLTEGELDLGQITRFPTNQGDAHMDVAASVPVPDSQDSAFSFRNPASQDTVLAGIADALLASQLVRQFLHVREGDGG